MLTNHQIAGYLVFKQTQVVGLKKKKNSSRVRICRADMSHPCPQYALVPMNHEYRNQKERMPSQAIE